MRVQILQQIKALEHVGPITEGRLLECLKWLTAIADETVSENRHSQKFQQARGELVEAAKKLDARLLRLPTLSQGIVHEYFRFIGHPCVFRQPHENVTKFLIRVLEPSEPSNEKVSAKSLGEKQKQARRIVASMNSCAVLKIHNIRLWKPLIRQLISVLPGIEPDVAMKAIWAMAKVEVYDPTVWRAGTDCVLRCRKGVDTKTLSLLCWSNARVCGHAEDSSFSRNHARVLSLLETKILSTDVEFNAPDLIQVFQVFHEQQPHNAALLHALHQRVLRISHQLLPAQVGVIAATALTTEVNGIPDRAFFLAIAEAAARPEILKNLTLSQLADVLQSLQICGIREHVFYSVLHNTSPEAIRMLQNGDPFPTFKHLTALGCSKTYNPVLLHALVQTLLTRIPVGADLAARYGNFDTRMGAEVSTGVQSRPKLDKDGDSCISNASSSEALFGANSTSEHLGRQNVEISQPAASSDMDVSKPPSNLTGRIEGQVGIGKANELAEGLQNASNSEHVQNRSSPASTSGSSMQSTELKKYLRLDPPDCLRLYAEIQRAQQDTSCEASVKFAAATGPLLPRLKQTIIAGLMQSQVSSLASAAFEMSRFVRPDAKMTMVWTRRAQHLLNTSTSETLKRRGKTSDYSFWRVVRLMKWASILNINDPALWHASIGLLEPDVTYLKPWEVVDVVGALSKQLANQKGLETALEIAMRNLLKSLLHSASKRAKVFKSDDLLRLGDSTVAIGITDQKSSQLLLDSLGSEISDLNASQANKLLANCFRSGSVSSDKLQSIVDALSQPERLAGLTTKELLERLTCLLENLSYRSTTENLIVAGVSELTGRIQDADLGIVYQACMLFQHHCHHSAFIPETSETSTSSHESPESNDESTITSFGSWTQGISWSESSRTESVTSQSSDISNLSTSTAISAQERHHKEREAKLQLGGSFPPALFSACLTALSNAVQHGGSRTDVKGSDWFLLQHLKTLLLEVSEELCEHGRLASLSTNELISMVWSLREAAPGCASPELHSAIASELSWRLKDASLEVVYKVCLAFDADVLTDLGPYAPQAAVQLKSEPLVVSKGRYHEDGVNASASLASYLPEGERSSTAAAAFESSPGDVVHQYVSVSTTYEPAQPTFSNFYSSNKIDVPDTSISWSSPLATPDNISSSTFLGQQTGWSYPLSSSQSMGLERPPPALRSAIMEAYYTALNRAESQSPVGIEDWVYLQHMRHLVNDSRLLQSRVGSR